MASKMRLKGRAAVKYAEKYGLTLNKYADPTEGARSGLSVWEAEQILREDPRLIWVTRVSGRKSNPSPVTARKTKGGIVVSATVSTLAAAKKLARKMGAR